MPHPRRRARHVHVPHAVGTQRVADRNRRRDVRDLKFAAERSFDGNGLPGEPRLHLDPAVILDYNALSSNAPMLGGSYLQVPLSRAPSGAAAWAA